jgi:hypothetical protein
MQDGLSVQRASQAVGLGHAMYYRLLVQVGPARWPGVIAAAGLDRIRPYVFRAHYRWKLSFKNCLLVRTSCKINYQRINDVND